MSNGSCFQRTRERLILKNCLYFQGQAAYLAKAGWPLDISGTGLHNVDSYCYKFHYFCIDLLISLYASN